MCLALFLFELLSVDVLSLEKFFRRITFQVLLKEALQVIFQLPESVFYFSKLDFSSKAFFMLKVLSKSTIKLTLNVFRVMADSNVL